jgi:plastocyanin
MKLAYTGIVLSILLFAVSSYFLFFAKEEVAQTTTTTLGATTTTAISGRGGRITTVNEVSIYSDRFEPSQLTIKSDEKVKWINKDDKQHEVVCVDANQNPLFDAILNPGESWEFYLSLSAECWDPSVSEQGMRMSITV